MDIYQIVSLIQNIEISFSGSVTLHKETFDERGIINRVSIDIQANDDLLTSVEGNRCFQELFSCLYRFSTSSSGSNNSW